MTDDAQGYDIAAIRELLLAAFTAEDLHRLFLYTSNEQLKPMQHQFSPGDGLEAVVDKIIIYCQMRALLPNLLKEAELANPRMYARFASRLVPTEHQHKKSAAPLSTPTFPSGKPPRGGLVQGLRDPAWQGVAAIIALVALAVTLGTWFWPNIRSILSPTPAPTPTPKPIIIALQSFHDGRSVTATDAGQDWVLKTAIQAPDERQWFTLQCLNDGRISLKTYDNRYVTAMNDEGERDWVLGAETVLVQDWEKFTVVDAETKEELLCSGKFGPSLLGKEKVKIGLKTAHGRYVTALNDEAGRDWMLRAETTELQDWETFTLVVLQSP